MKSRILLRIVISLVLAAVASLGNAVPLVIVQVAPFSGPEANQGRAYAEGVQLYFDAVNKRGGVNGHTFTLVRKDDAGRPDETLSETKALVAREHPLALCGYFGNRNLDQLVGSGLLEQERIPLIGYRTSEIRGESAYLYSIRAGLRDEIHKILEHLATIGITRIGLFFEGGPGATSLLAATADEAKITGAQVVVKAAYSAGTARVSPAVEAFLQVKPQAILLTGSGAAVAGFIEQYRTGGGAAQLFAHSGAEIEQLSQRVSDEQLQGVAIAQVTPNPYKTSLRLTKEFSDEIAQSRKGDAPVSYAMLEGYIAARVIVEAVRRQGARVTREGMVRALDTMSALDLGGYFISFKNGSRSGSRRVELSIITSAGRIRQ